MRRRSDRFAWGSGFRDDTYLHTLADTIEGPFQTPWWYAMAAAAAIVAVGVVGRNAVTVAVGIATGAFFIAFWIVVGTLEHLRRRSV